MRYSLTPSSQNNKTFHLAIPALPQVGLSAMVPRQGFSTNYCNNMTCQGQETPMKEIGLTWVLIT